MQRTFRNTRSRRRFLVGGLVLSAVVAVTPVAHAGPHAPEVAYPDGGVTLLEAGVGAFQSPSASDWSAGVVVTSKVPNTRAGDVIVAFVTQKSSGRSRHPQQVVVRSDGLAFLSFFEPIGSLEEAEAEFAKFSGPMQVDYQTSRGTSTLRIAEKSWKIIPTYLVEGFKVTRSSDSLVLEGTTVRPSGEKASGVLVQPLKVINAGAAVLLGDSVASSQSGRFRIVIAADSVVPGRVSVKAFQRGKCLTLCPGSYAKPVSVK